MRRGWVLEQSPHALVSSAGNMPGSRASLKVVPPKTAAVTYQSITGCTNKMLGRLACCSTHCKGHFQRPPVCYVYAHNWRKLHKSKKCKLSRTVRTYVANKTKPKPILRSRYYK